MTQAKWRRLAAAIMAAGLLAVATAGQAVADTAFLTVNGVTYAVDTETQTACLKDGSLMRGAFTVPDAVTYGGVDYAVTAIGEKAFMNNTGLTSIHCGAVTRIGIYAFMNCTGLTAAELSQVDEVGNWAFGGCTGLTTVDFGAVTRIGDWAFRHCDGLTAVDLKQVTALGSASFAYCVNLSQIRCDVLVSMGSQVFRNCDALHLMTLPTTLTEIGKRAFYQDLQLEYVRFTGDCPDGLNDTAWDDCDALCYIGVPDGMQEAYRAALPAHADKVIDWSEGLQKMIDRYDERARAEEKKKEEALAMLAAAGVEAADVSPSEDGQDAVAADKDAPAMVDVDDEDDRDAGRWVVFGVIEALVVAAVTAAVMRRARKA